MAGIYIHIPFCRKACHYCNFHFSTSKRHVDQMYKAITDEIELKKEFLGQEAVHTIYFGGGTPSLIPTHHLEVILSSIHKHFKVDALEITIEANPEDITLEKIRGWQALDIDRISLGIQSFFEEDLKAMNRSHDATQSFMALDRLQEASFNNVSIDLIYGMPWSSIERFEQNLQKVIDYGIPHLSAYALTVEPKTALAHQIKTKKVPPVSDSNASSCFLVLQEWAKANKFQHYEISNLCLSGHQAKHNSSYWSGQKYLGLGPAAHSYNGAQRIWTISNNQKYIDGISQGYIEESMETLTDADKYNEYVMTGLRMISGINTKQIAIFGDDFLQHFHQESEILIRDGKLIMTDDRLFIPGNARFMSDGIASDLFYIDS